MWQHPEGTRHIVVTLRGQRTAPWCTHCVPGTLRGYVAAPWGSHHATGTPRGPAAAPITPWGLQWDLLQDPKGT